MGKTKAPPVIIADFETRGIEARPKYPPKPVSLALKWPDTREFELLAWGHGDGSRAAGNNCTEKEARSRLKRAYDSHYGFVFQNGSFDQDVAESHWDIPLLPWERSHDTMFLIFLWDPHAPSLGLKESAERLLGVPPDEQDKMYEWIIANVPEAKRKPSSAGAYICECPYQIVKPYHKGDLTRTGSIFDLLWPRIVDSGMQEAYDRERRLMPILLQNARVGMRIDVDGLDRDIPAMRAGLSKADSWLCKRLGGINLDSPKQLGDALYDKGIVTEFKTTAKGQRSTSKKHLTIDRFSDKKVYQVLTYRSQMDTALGTFMESWRELAGDGNIIYPSWSQVRSAKGDTKDTKGARSGRIICAKPNFLNIPKKWKKAIVAGYAHPAWLNVPELPYIRTYALPDVGEVWCRRDFNQQEIRLFAHYEEGPVMEGLLSDPKFDIHEIVRAEEERMLVDAGLRESFDRDTAKNTVFARIYGQGITGLMETLKLADDERVVAQLVQKAINTAVPSIKALDDQLKELVNSGRPIKTWGGRLYYKEPSKYVEKFGRDMDFAYKMLNYLCQGSGADVTKETLIRYDSHPKRLGRLVVTVYDEIDTSNAPSAVKQDMTVLKECMRSIETDVPMLSDGEIGPSWGALKGYAI